jgi:hypothetical protein
MRKVVIAAQAAVVAIAPALLLVAHSGVAYASPNPVATDHSPGCPENFWMGYLGLCWPPPAVSGPKIIPCSHNGYAPGDVAAGICLGAVPPTAASTQAPATRPVQTPQVNPPSPGAPRNAGLVAPPKGLNAPPAAVEAAKKAPAARIDPANPPNPPTKVDFTKQVQSVISAHNNNVDVVKVDNLAQIRPRHWDYLDYDVYHRPSLYNPLTEAMTFRYFYSGEYRQVYVAAGSRTVLDVATVGAFPFTAVGENYLTVGSFTGGAWIPPEGWDGPPPPDYTPPAVPPVYQDVAAYVPAANQTVQVGQVQVVGHDPSQPAGSQDTFMLDDSTLAWGQVTNPANGGQVTVTKTQSLPGIGPTDNGTSLVSLAANQQPTDTGWPWPIKALGVAVLVLAVGLVAWVLGRRKRGADLPAGV